MLDAYIDYKSILGLDDNSQRNSLMRFDYLRTCTVPMGV